MGLIALGAAALALLLLTIAGAALLARRSRPWTDEEYDRRRGARGSGLLAASMKALGEELGPGGRKVAEEREAFAAGAYREADRSGDPPTP